MESHELLRDVLQTKNPKEIAAEMGLSLSLIYKWAEPPEAGGTGSGAANPLDRAAALVRATGDARLIQWLCQSAGGFYVRNPRDQWPHPYHLVPATNQIVQEFADLLAVIAAAAADNHISQPEAANIRGRWEELKTVTEGFVRCCEEGNFSQFKTTPKPARADTGLRPAQAPAP